MAERKGEAVDLSFEEILNEIKKLPEFAPENRFKPNLSFPLLKEADGKLYIVYMAYIYGEAIPDFYVLYEIRDKRARSLKNSEVMELFGWNSISSDNPLTELILSPEEISSEEDEEDESWDDETRAIRDNAMLEDLFAKSLADGQPDWDSFRQYIIMLARMMPFEREYYLAFLPETE